VGVADVKKGFVVRKTPTERLVVFLVTTPVAENVMDLVTTGLNGGRAVCVEPRAVENQPYSQVARASNRTCGVFSI
jgi:hypothetical protein